MKRQIGIKWLLIILLLSTCSDVSVPAAQPGDAETMFVVSETLEKDAPTSFINLDWSQPNKITIRGLWLEKYPAFIGEIDTRKVFPFYMNNSVISGSLLAVSGDGNYLAYQTDAKLYIASMTKVVSNGYSIDPESVISVFEERFRCGLAWSPNSLQLASICLTLDGIKISLYNVGSDDLQEVFRYSEENIDDIEGVSWSSNSSILAFSLRYGYDDKEKNTSQKDIFLFRLNPHVLLRLTNTPGDEQYPDWYPGGFQILTFTFTPEGAGESLRSRLMFSTEDGKCVKQGSDIVGIVSPSWSPDGSQIAYISEWASIKIIETSNVIHPEFLTPEGLCNTSN